MANKETRRGTVELPFRTKLQEIMATRGLTLSQIAGISGVSKTVVHDWTAGSTPHDIKAVGRLARALGISLRELLLDEPENEFQGATVLSASDQTEFGQKSEFDEEELIQGVFKISVSRLRGKFQK